MTELALTPEEAEVLRQVLGRCVSDLELEIAHTDHADFRAMLRQRRAVLTGLHARLEHKPAMHQATAPLL
jgi:hypothetical protein